MFMFSGRIFIICNELVQLKACEDFYDLLYQGWGDVCVGFGFIFKVQDDPKSCVNLGHMKGFT